MRTNCTPGIFLIEPCFLPSLQPLETSTAGPKKNHRQCQWRRSPVVRVGNQWPHHVAALQKRNIEKKPTETPEASRIL
jgi:hypothetical protein